MLCEGRLYAVEGNSLLSMITGKFRLIQRHNSLNAEVASIGTGLEEPEFFLYEGACFVKPKGIFLRIVVIPSLIVLCVVVVND